MRLEDIIIPNLESNQSENCYWVDGVWHTRGELLNIVNNCEKVLKRAGFSRGQRLVVMLRNSPLIPAISLAVWKLGGIFCPLNEKSGYESLAGTLELIKPFAVISGHDIEGLKWPCFTCDLNADTLPEITGKTQPPEPDSANYAVMFSTSGTTGLPKAVPLTHENLYSNCIATNKMVESISGKDTFLNVLPNFHSFGYTLTIIFPLLINAKIACVPSFLPPSLTIRALTEAKIDVMYVVPAIMSFLLMSVEKGKMPPEPLSRIRIICTGGDKLNPNVHKQAINFLGRDIMEGYGLTETSPVICMNKDCITQRTGSIGQVIDGYDYKLRTREGQDTTDNEGVLWVKGASVTPGYFHAPEITAERFDSEGFFNTGDYVKIDSDGFVYILDRVTDIIIVGGFNVYPQEVEKVLAEHPAVRQAVVVGMPHDINGQIPKAYILLEEGADDSSEQKRDIIRFAKEKLAHFKVPRAVEFVNEFPLSGTGKILRRVLRDMAAKEH
ncbi:MAG: AMP-binding protein [Synergistaceae bacterium]|nr:AMP-binding protein [Synergistaceae bacterium]